MMADGTAKQAVQEQRKQKGFQKGQSGNPGGRPKGGASLAATIRKRLTPEEAERITDHLFEIIRERPQPRTMYGKGDIPYESYDTSEVKLFQWACETILERVDGKVTQPLSGDPAAPIHLHCNMNLTPKGHNA